MSSLQTGARCLSVPQLSFDVVADDLLGVVVVVVVDSLLLVLFVVISLFTRQTHSYRDGCECIPVV